MTGKVSLEAMSCAEDPGRVKFARHVYSPPCDVRSKLNTSLRDSVTPSITSRSPTVIPSSPPIGLPSAVSHCIPGVTGKPSVSVAVHMSMYVWPAMLLPSSSMVMVGGGGAVMDGE